MHGATDNATKGIPAFGIKPIGEIVNAILHQVLGWPEVEVRIELQTINTPNQQ